jgi:hypothetical protein
MGTEGTVLTKISSGCGLWEAGDTQGWTEGGLGLHPLLACPQPTLLRVRWPEL